MNRLGVVVFAMAVAACGGESPTGTGGGGGSSGGGSGGGGGGTSCSATNCAGCMNGACQPGSTAAACGKNGGACVACGAQTLCKVDQTCGIDPESTWMVQPTSATITTKNGGADWDVGGGAPDPYVSTWCPADAATPSFTPTVDDSFTPTWTSGGCTAKARELVAKGFAIQVTDEDISSNDGISGKGTISVTEADLLSGRMTGITNNATLTTLTVTFTKQ